MHIVFALLAMFALMLRGAYAFSATVANDWVNYITRGVQPTTLVQPIKFAIHTGDPGTTGANEAVGGSYARQNANYNPASGGVGALSSTVSFAGLPAGTYTHLSTWDSSPTPKFIQGAPLAVPKTIGNGDGINITAASNTVTG